MLDRRDNVTAFPTERRAFEVMVDRAAHKRATRKRQLDTEDIVFSAETGALITSARDANVIPFPRVSTKPVMVPHDDATKAADATNADDADRWTDEELARQIANARMVYDDSDWI